MKGLSATHALIDLLKHLHKITQNGIAARICIIDYSKASDLNYHNLLITKFEKLNLDPVMSDITAWLRHYLTNSEQSK